MLLSSSHSKKTDFFFGHLYFGPVALCILNELFHLKLKKKCLIFNFSVIELPRPEVKRVNKDVRYMPDVHVYARHSKSYCLGGRGG